MRRFTTIAAVAALVAPVLTIAAVPAQASGCVTAKEYRHAKSAWQMEGLARAGVRYYFGFDGRQISKSNSRMTRRYQGCGSRPAVRVNYRYVPSITGKAWMAMSMTRSGDHRVTLCTPWGRPSAYPFNSLLTTAKADTRNPQTRSGVRSIQKALRALGFRDSNGRSVIIDGSYGQQTASAVRRFQHQQGLIVDGTVGAQTWRRLAKRYCYF